MSPSNERSAEWLRGRKEAIFEIYDAWKCMDSAPFRHYIHEIADDALASDDIAAAEAREAAPGDSLSTTVEKLREACSGVRVAPEPDAPTAAQVVEACRVALEEIRAAVTASTGQCGVLGTNWAECDYCGAVSTARKEPIPHEKGCAFAVSTAALAVIDNWRAGK